MHRIFARRVCLGLIAFGCGSPGDLDRSQFPELEATGYPDRVGAAGAGGTFAGAGGGNFGGTPGVGGSGTGGTAPSGGAGGSLNASGTGGQSGSGQGGTGQGGSGAEPGGCPEDITLLLNRPATDGGCAGGGCHVPGGTPPDLTSPGVEARVLNVMSSAACSARPYVGADDSVLEEKITNPDPSCGEPMPFFAADRLNDEDRACIVQWIGEISGGM